MLCKILAFITLVLRAGSPPAIVGAFCVVFQSRLFQKLGGFLNNSHFLGYVAVAKLVPAALPYIVVSA